MNLSTIISITISLTFLYLVFSLVTSEIQEILARVFNLRANNLRDSIIGLLGETKDGDNLEITKKLYEKLHIGLPSSTEQKLESTKISYISDEKFANSLIKTVREELKYQDQNSPSMLQGVIDDIKNSSLPPKLKRDLSFLAQKAQNRFSERGKELLFLDQEIKTWFNDSMEHASERYKRKAKLISFLIGLILVIVANVDTLNIVNNLSKTEVLSSALSNTAIEVIKSNADLTSCSSTNNEGSDVDQNANLTNCIASLQNQLNVALDGVDNLPIGWNFSAPFKEQFTPFNFPNVFKAVLGWFISAIAISMGAPFWFAFLNNLINVQSSKNQAKS